MGDENVITAKELMLTELYKGAASIGDQRATASSDNQAEQDMLAAMWNECQLEIDKVMQAPDGDSYQDALEFLERSFVSDS
jgi:hypothetical protein